MCLKQFPSLRRKRIIDPLFTDTLIKAELAMVYIALFVHFIWG